MVLRYRLYTVEWGIAIPTYRKDLTMNNNKVSAWDTYKLALSKGEINADTYALLTADLPRGE
jgi:hypothetical protein